MKPTNRLMDEHRVIEQVLDCLQAMTDQVEAGEELDVYGARLAVDFLRNFADGCHHDKEEAYLFPMLEARGFSPEQGPTGVMRSEHDEGRRMTREIAQAIDDASEGDPQAGKRFVASALSLVALLHEHIQKEDHCLFPMADRALSDFDQRALMDQFESVERDEGSVGVCEHWLAIADQLADRFDVPRASVENARASIGCGATAT